MEHLEHTREVCCRLTALRVVVVLPLQKDPKIRASRTFCSKSHSVMRLFLHPHQAKSASFESQRRDALGFVEAHRSVHETLPSSPFLGKVKKQRYPVGGCPPQASNALSRTFRSKQRPNHSMKPPVSNCWRKTVT